MTSSVNVEEVMAELKDFQRATAEYAFQQLYGPNPTHRFLVADEVGLGKTLVARGVIARAIDHLKREGDLRTDIVYVCSNAAIAEQNLAKLNVLDRDATAIAERITLLAVGDEAENALSDDVNFIAITPNTSLRLGNSPGQFKERALLYALLDRITGDGRLQTAGGKRAFYLGISEDDVGAARRRLDELVRRYAKRLDAKTEFVRRFRDALKECNRIAREAGKSWTWQSELREICEAVSWKRSSYADVRPRRNRFIGRMREILAMVSIESLAPDLVILDEFQRFKDLLDLRNDSWTSQLARRLFEYQDPESGRLTRTLLLSATPYRMFTMHDDGHGDDHHKDLIHTATFLFNDPVEGEDLSLRFKRVRDGLLALGQDDGASARAACADVAEKLRRVMARTERLAATPDRDGMLTTARIEPPRLRETDIRGYLALAKVAEALEERDLLEMWKSAPFVFNFMEGYKIKEALDAELETGRMLPPLVEALRAGHGVLPWEEVDAYREIDPGNPCFRWFAEDTLRGESWRLLWLPPCQPYYSAGSEFETEDARRLTKRLVFSAWRVVPKALAALLSYEAERRLVAAGESKSKLSYATDSRERPGRRLQFRMKGREPATMTAFGWVYPSPQLSQLGDPLRIASELRRAGKLPTAGAVLEAAMAAIAPKLVALRGMVKATTTGSSEAWYTLAPILLDLRADESATLAFLERRGKESPWIGAVDLEDDEEGADETGSRAFDAHRKRALDWLRHDAHVGPMPDDLATVLAELAVGSPANVALRSLARVQGGQPKRALWEARAGAARVAWGFRSLFNGPDVTDMVGTRRSDLSGYWRAVLAYCIDGNLQAVMDEYVHVLREWLGKVRATGDDVVEKCSEAIYDALTLRTVSYRADAMQADGAKVKLERRAMRGRFAVRFGDERQMDEKQVVRAKQTSRAFNSPFWPFVLTSTSVGQEGLDFHLYCHAVVHWNLPRNPVDLEQREGRVHRYKGHAVRKNVARRHGGVVFAGVEGDPWREMFEAAAGDRPKGESEIVPYWVYNPDGSGARIERYVPALPLSRDAGLLGPLLKSVATYRLAFGQPRQEELVAFLAGQVAGQSKSAALALHIDLRPSATASQSSSPASPQAGYARARRGSAR